MAAAKKNVQGEKKLSQLEILAKVKSGELTTEQAAEMLKPPVKPVTFKVSDKGAVSLYGLQRFPVTLYAPQWERVIAAVPELQKFIKEHADELTTEKDAA